MPATTTLVELFRVEKQREQELEEARVIQSAMLPACPLHTENVIISHEFQPVTDAETILITSSCLTARSGCT